MCILLAFVLRITVTGVKKVKREREEAGDEGETCKLSGTEIEFPISVPLPPSHNTRGSVKCCFPYVINKQ